MISLDTIKRLSIPGTERQSRWRDSMVDYGCARRLSGGFGSVIYVFHAAGLFDYDDPVTNSVRFGASRFVGDCLRAMGESRLGGLSLEAAELWGLAHEPGPDEAIPWAKFAAAMPGLFGDDNFWDASDEVERDAVSDGGYYNAVIDVFFDGQGSCLEIRFGWQDMCPVRLKFDEDSTEDDLRRALPPYMAAMV